MALNLSIIKSPAGVNLAVSQKTFSEQGGTIGRGDGNDWVLGDPDRFLSSRHCAVSFESGQYYLTDTSTNGTFINGAPEPIGKGGKVPVNNGDTIEVGDYQFRVELAMELDMSNDPFAASAAPVSDPFQNSGADPFGGGADPFGAAPAASDADPFATPSAQNDLDPFASAPQNDLDPFASAPVSGGQDPFGSGADPFASAPPPASADPFGSDPFAASDDISLNPDPLNADPLAALDKVSPNNNFQDPIQGNNFSTSLEEPMDPLGNDPLFGGGSSLEEPQPSAPFPGGASMGDGAGALNQAVDWPDAKSDSLIPEDWDDDFLGASSPEPAPIPEVAPAPVPSRPPRPEMDISAAHRSIPLTTPPKQSTPPPAPSEPLLSERQPERVEPYMRRDRDVAREPAPAPVPQAAQAQPRSAAPAPSSKAAQGIGQALLSGLGLEQKELSNEDVEEIAGAIGELMPVIVEGMMQVLRSRASIKNEFRMNVTTIQPIENNPLKFSVDANEAIENMFLRKSSAYMAPKEAFQEGFNGVGEHQVAIIAGIRAAFKSMMDGFDPERLEKQFDKQNKGVALPGMQKAKYWNNYVDQYKGFVDNMENTFQYLFGDEFVQAYEEQLRKLSVERKQRQKYDN